MYFFAPLANVDESILNLKLKNGFKISSMSSDKGSKIISEIERIADSDIKRWPHFSTVFSQKKMYFVSNSFEFDPSKTNKEGNFVAVLDLYFFVRNLVDHNLTTTLQQLRLFKEGNIYTPFWCVYSCNDDKITVLGTGLGTSNIQYPNLFHLDDSEIENIQKFIEITEMPLKIKYLKLAHENFELSYTESNPSLCFLSLMIASEVLFNPGSEELIHRISRNFAVLLGNSVDDSIRIQKEIKGLYKKRSSLVHNGKEILNFAGEENYVLKIRDYVRRSIKKLILINLSKKDDLLELLNSKGFGQLNDL